MKELQLIQQKLKAPKGQYNSFGKYHYRSCEDILEAVKPLLTEAGCELTLSDDIIVAGDRYYVKATATIRGKDGSETVTAYAREPEQKKGMDTSQITGTASSYARKYALNGLFLIDDTKDADTDEYKNQQNNASEVMSNNEAQKPITDREKKTIKEWIKALGVDEQKFRAYMGRDVDEYTRFDYERAYRSLQKKEHSTKKQTEITQ